MGENIDEAFRSFRKDLDWAKLEKIIHIYLDKIDLQRLEYKHRKRREKKGE